MTLNGAESSMYEIETIQVLDKDTDGWVGRNTF